jgi:hypothetical protein
MSGPLNRAQQHVCRYQDFRHTTQGEAALGQIRWQLLATRQPRDGSRNQKPKDEPRGSSKYVVVSRHPVLRCHARPQADRIRHPSV